MPNMATLTMNNYAAVAVNYEVLGIKDGVASWADKAQGTVGGYRSLSAEIRRPSDPTKQVTRTVLTIARPVVNATTGAVDYVGRVKIEILQPPGMTLTERQEQWAAMKNFAAHTFVSDIVTKQESMF